MKKWFMPITDEKRLPWLENFDAEISTYKTKYNLTDADIAKVHAILLAITYWLNVINIFDRYLSGAKAYKNELISGAKKGAGSSLAPVIPDPGIAPPHVDAAAFTWVGKLGNSIKNHPDYTIADGKALGLEGTQVNEQIPETLVFSLKTGAGGHPEIVWQKYGADGIHIYVKRSKDSDWQFLATDTVPNYIDTFQLPANGESALWKYKIIYFKNDEQTGNWSNEVSITVTGM